MHHGFDLEQLKTLIASADAGSLTAAAALRFRSQSAISEQLNKLEEAAGTQLMIRSKQGVQPTHAGERLITHAREILALSDAAWRDMHGVSVEGEVRIGISDYFQTRYMVRLLAKIKHQYPNLKMSTQIAKSDDIVNAYSKGDVDIAIILRATESDHASLPNAVALRSEPMLWVAARDQPIFPDHNAIKIALLSETCSLHRLARNELTRHGIKHTVAHIASGVAGLQAAVAAGLGIGCLNASAVIEEQMAEVAGLPALPAATIFLLPPDPQKGQLTERSEAVVQAVVATLAP